MPLLWIRSHPQPARDTSGARAGEVVIYFPSLDYVSLLREWVVSGKRLGTPLVKKAAQELGHNIYRDSGSIVIMPDYKVKS